jgi:hypothetical protein
MDNIIIESKDFSFDEFAAQHPNDVRVLPDQNYLDGALICSIVIPIVYDLIKELIKYINKHKHEKELASKLHDGKDHVIRLLLPNDTVLEIPMTEETIDAETICKEISDELNKAE